MTLCLYSPTMDIAKLSATLRCTPTYAHEKGQLRLPPHGSGPAPVGLWSLDAPKRLGFVEKIQYLLDATPKRVPTWRRLAKNHDVQLRCGLFLHSWNAGFDLPADTVAEIGARGWKFAVDIYGAEGGEVIAAFLSKSRKVRGR